VWFIRNVLFEEEKTKSPNTWYFVENTTDITLQVLKMQQISLLPEYINEISRGIFLCMFKHVNAGHLKVKFKQSF
jgi:hypothetical protein